MARRGQGPRVSQERWLVSYADFITLLFAFFVVLFATAEADKHKQVEFSQSVNEAFRALGISQIRRGNIPAQARLQTRLKSQPSP